MLLYPLRRWPGHGPALYTAVEWVRLKWRSAPPGRVPLAPTQFIPETKHA